MALNKAKVIQGLNEALSIELAATIQYLEQSCVVQGLERRYLEEFFLGQSKEAHRHAKLMGDKITALGGVPTSEPGTVQVAMDVPTMLEQDLAMEERALRKYEEVLKVAQEDTDLRVLLEEQVHAETGDVEELKKILSMVRYGR